MSADGLAGTEIGTRLDLSPEAVSRIRRRFHEGGHGRTNRPPEGSSQGPCRATQEIGKLRAGQEARSSSVPVSYTATMRSTLTIRRVVTAVVVALATGCGAGGADPNAGDRADAAARLTWPGDATLLVARQQGPDGYPFTPPVGSECDPDGRFELAIPQRTYSWRWCRRDPSASPVWPYRVTEGSRVLSEEEMTGVIAAYQRMEISGQSTCGADKGRLSVLVRTPNGEREYQDLFYACEQRGIYVAGIDFLFESLRALVPPPPS